MALRLVQSARSAALAVATVGLLAGTPLPSSPAFARSAPESFADLAESVIGAVVNISAATTVSEQRNVPLPQLPPGSPFQEFFDEFFNRGPASRARATAATGPSAGRARSAPAS